MLHSDANTISEVCLHAVGFQHFPPAFNITVYLTINCKKKSLFHLILEVSQRLSETVSLMLQAIIMHESACRSAG